MAVNTAFASLLGNLNLEDPCLQPRPWESIPSESGLPHVPVSASRSSASGRISAVSVADSVHCALLKFLFLRSCEPYFGFVRSWIFEAKIDDPFEEFIVANSDDPDYPSQHDARVSFDFPSSTVKKRDGVAVPCFLKNSFIPLFRAGLQLQVLMKLLELYDFGCNWNRAYKDFLPCYSGTSSDFLSLTSPLTFNKKDIEAIVLARTAYYRSMMEKLEHFWERSGFRDKQEMQQYAVPASVCGRDLMVSSVANGGPILPLTKKSNPILPLLKENSDASGVVSELEEPLGSSECSSLSGFEEEEEEQLDKPVELLHDVVEREQKYLSALRFYDLVDFSLQKPSKSEVSCAVDNESPGKSKKTKSSVYFCDIHGEGTELFDALPLQLHPFLSRMSENQHPVGHHCMNLPLGSFMKNHVGFSKGTVDDAFSNVPCVPKAIHESSEVQAESTPRSSSIGLPEMDVNKDPYQSENLPGSKSWMLKCRPNVLCTNPILTKSFFLQLTRKTTEGCCREFAERVPFFDFMSVEDPFKVFVGKFQVGVGNNLSVPANSSTSPISNLPNEDGGNAEELSTDKSRLSKMCVPLAINTDSQGNLLFPNVSGGSGWEILLGSLYMAVSGRTGGLCVATTFEMPLDFVIEKCLCEEIQLQYDYVSKMTIKLLQEGFNLQEHLLALRRYHMMGSADWADLFIMSLWRHKLLVAGADKRISEIQGILEFSVQRSSCGSDCHKDRLFIYVKEENPNFTDCGIYSFDVLGLGYKVDWPVSIVITPRALETYAEIFSFLLQVKLASSSLNEVWTSFKEQMHLMSRNHHHRINESEVCRFNTLMKLRQQINHFVTTLQHYVQSQLSHVSWSKFLHSLKHKVKDMMDLECVHMNYLTDSLQICFLSNETKPIASIVRGILQCALDFRSSLVGDPQDGKFDRGSLSNMSDINFSQVITIKENFDKNVKDLYMCYLKSPKNGELCLPRFWEYLNYNEHYSEAIGTGITHSTFSI